MCQVALPSTFSVTPRGPMQATCTCPIWSISPLVWMDVFHGTQIWPGNVWAYLGSMEILDHWGQQGAVNAFSTGKWWEIIIRVMETTVLDYESQARRWPYSPRDPPDFLLDNSFDTDASSSSSTHRYRMPCQSKWLWFDHWGGVRYNLRYQLGGGWPIPQLHSRLSFLYRCMRTMEYEDGRVMRWCCVLPRQLWTKWDIRR